VVVFKRKCYGGRNVCRSTGMCEVIQDIRHAYFEKLHGRALI